MTDLSLSLFAPPHKEGHLHKRGKAWPHKWHKRYFVLRGNEFLCYKSLKETNPHGRLIVTNASCIIGPKDLEFRVEITDKTTPSTTTTTTAKVTTTHNEEDKSRVWKLKASSKQELEEWCQMIQKAILYSGSTFAEMQSPPPLISAEQAPATGLDAEIQKKMQRMSLPRNFQMGSLAPPQPKTPTPDAKRKSAATPKDSAFKRLSKLFFTPKQEEPAPVEEKPVSLVELYFQQQEEMQHKKDAIKKGNLNDIGEISSFDQLRELINTADENGTPTTPKQGSMMEPLKDSPAKPRVRRTSHAQKKEAQNNNSFDTEIDLSTESDLQSIEEDLLDAKSAAKQKHENKLQEVIRKNKEEKKSQIATHQRSNSQDEKDEYTDSSATSDGDNSQKSAVQEEVPEKVQPKRATIGHAFGDHLKREIEKSTQQQQPPEKKQERRRSILLTLTDTLFGKK